MKAIYYELFGGAEVLKYGDRPTPTPGPGEVLIQVHAASVNPVDWKIREGWFEGLFATEFPVIPGWDAAGVIAAAGTGVTGLDSGDRVCAYCRKPVIQGGTYAEYVCVPAHTVAPIPHALDFVQAATIPLAGLTVWQALVEFAGLKAGQAILIHAGAGGVGSLAVQIAHHLGATVWATASKANHDYVRTLGADEIIDYRNEDTAARVRDHLPGGFDVVFDTVGGSILDACYDLVKPGGALPALNDAPDPEMCAARDIRCLRVFSEPNGEHLAALGQMIDAGALKPAAIETFALQQAAQAMERSQHGHVRGKLVLEIR